MKKTKKTPDIMAAFWEVKQAKQEAEAAIGEALKRLVNQYPVVVTGQDVDEFGNVTLRLEIR